MKKLVFLLVFIVIIGCKLSTNPYDNLDYRQGTEGLVVDFAQNSPMQKVYEDSKLGLVLEVRNKGANDIEDGDARIYLSGFDPEAIHFSGVSGGSVTLDVPAVLGKSPYMPDGGYDALDVPEDSPVRVPFGDSYTAKIMATSCYVYETIATPTVCVVSDPAAIYKDNICEPSTITMSSQGGPVAVTKVEEEVMQQKLNFIITVQNVGGGRVIDKEQMDRCPNDLDHNTVDVVDVKAELSSGGEPECSPSDNRLRLVDGKGVIFCKIPVELHTSYTAPLVITLDYGYSSSVTRDIEIVRPPGSAKNTQ